VPCLGPPEDAHPFGLVEMTSKVRIFSLSITSIFARIHKAPNVDKKNTNCTVYL
jgi:hypothetical protein